MLKRIISFVFLVSLLCNSTSFAHTLTVENSGSNKYKAVRLIPQVYNNSNADLSDILVKNSNGETVPYFINSSYQTIYKGDYSYPLKLINSYTKDDSFYFDFKVKDMPKNDVIATSINVTTGSTNFAKKIELYGSYDNLAWEKVQDDTLYNVDNNKKLEIVLNKQQKYTHYRFKLANNLEKIVFDFVDLKYNVTTNQKSYFIESVTPKFNLEEKDKKTYIHIDGLKNLKIAEITIQTDSMFKRVARVFDISKEIYNLSLNNTTYTDTTIPVNMQISKDDILTVTINNNDDKPINISGISIKYYADEIIFDGNSDSYTINFGPDTTIKAPVYDIASYKDEIFKSNIDRLNTKEIKFDKITEQPQYNFKVIFNIVVVVIAVLLGLLILLKLKKK